MTNPAGLLATAMLVLIGLYVLYWVIRYGVRDGVRDAERCAETPRPTSNREL